MDSLKDLKYRALVFMMAGFVAFLLDYLIGFVGIAAPILLFLGIKEFLNPENTHFTKSRKNIIFFTIFYVIYYATTLLATFTSAASGLTGLICNITRAIATINFIYLTHYFTEGVLLDAKMAKVNFVKLGLNTPWTLMGLLAMFNVFVSITFKQPIPSICALLALAMCGYYCATLHKAFPIVYKKKK